MTPEAVAAEVDAASLLGRGGAGFPAGRKWSMLRKDPVTYLVVNGDESEPATFKDHLLIERDPHQLIEGVIIAAYALQVTQAFIYVRGEFALGSRAGAGRRSTTPTPTARSGPTSSARGSRSTWWSTPAPAPTSAARRRPCSSRSRASAASPASSRPYFPAAIGLYGQPTVVNNVETHVQPAVDRHQRRRRLRRPRARAARPAPGSSPCPATCAARASTRSRW